MRREAIDALAPDAVVLDLGTGALALLARRAAKAGARRVYAVQNSEILFEKVSSPFFQYASNLLAMASILRAVLSICPSC